jgi:hypothetical protein
MSLVGISMSRYMNCIINKKIVDKNNSEAISEDASSDKLMVTKKSRLPCRGCTSSCTDYDRCDGRPWRLIQQNS